MNVPSAENLFSEIQQIESSNNAQIGTFLHNQIDIPITTALAGVSVAAQRTEPYKTLVALRQYVRTRVSILGGDNPAPFLLTDAVNRINGSTLDNEQKDFLVSKIQVLPSQPVDGGRKRKTRRGGKKSKKTRRSTRARK